MKKLEFRQLDTKTLEKVLKQAEKGKVNSRTFYKAFNFVEDNNENIRQFDTGTDVVKYLNEQGIPEAEHYKYIFTCINGEGTKLYLLNGWHFCDRLYYLVSTIGWSTGDKEADGNISIEVNY